MMNNNVGNIVIEDATLLFRNFAGKEGPYNAEGDRNFCVLIPEELVEALLQDGWNIKTLKPQDDEPPKPYMQVTVKFKIRPPNLVLITSKGRTPLGVHECEILDWLDIKTADVVIRPYEWSVGGKGGIKAYVKSLFITMEEDPLELKYASVPLASGETTKAIEGGKMYDFEGEVVDVEV